MFICIKKIKMLLYISIIMLQIILLSIVFAVALGLKIIVDCC